MNLKQLEVAVRELAKANPDFVYSRGEEENTVASYAPDKRNPQGCIMGAALRVAWDGSVPVIADIMRAREGEPITYILADLGLVGMAERNDDGAQWFLRVQQSQDDGHTWADAIEWADSEVNE